MGKRQGALEGMVMEDSLATFYKGKTVLVTGHTGFKGGWLAAWLKLLGARVIGYSLPPEPDRPSLFEAACIDQNLISITGDIRDLTSLSSAFDSHKPEIVFHLAAQSLVRRSYRDPIETYSTNVMGTMNVLESVRMTPSVRAVVVITSDKCYENQEWPWAYRETDPLGGFDPYSSSKGCAEIVTAAYRKSFFGSDSDVYVASTRAGNVIGGGDWAEDRLVPDIFRALSNGVQITLRNPDAIRPWQFVLEPLRGYLMLGERLWNEGEKCAEAWNFGPHDQDSISVLHLTRKVIQVWGAGEVVPERASDNPHEAHFLRLDSSKARSRLGWQPCLGIDEALEMTVEWYRAFYADRGFDGHSFTNKQIQQYTEKTLETLPPSRSNRAR
jgi:CDP-glucose 4,6-dehydratase